MTRNDLYHIDQKILKLKKESQALALLLRPQITRFYESAAHELAVTDGRFKAILSNYVEKDENGMFKTVTEDGNQKYKFRDSVTMDDKTIAFGANNVERLFNEEVSRLMSQIITIES